MDSLIKNFGIDLYVIIGQASSFLVLLFILNKFVYKPVLGILDKRKEKIDGAVQEAEALQKKNEEFTAENEQKMKEARMKLEKIVTSAKEKAKESAQEIADKASKEAQEILEKAKRDAESYKKELEKQISARVGEVSLLIAEKILQEKINLDEGYVEKRLKELKV